MTALLALWMGQVASAAPEDPSVEPTDLSELELRLAEHERALADLRKRLGDAERELDRIRHRRAPAKEPPSGGVVVPAGTTVTEATGYGDDVVVAGRVTGNATAFGGDVQVLDGGRVDGSAVAFGGVVEVRPGGEVRGGQVSFGSQEEPDDTDVDARGALPLPSFQAFFSGLHRRAVWFLTLAGAGVLLVGLVPKRVTRVAERVSEHPIRSLVFGSLATGFLGVSTVLFAITLLGLPVSLVLVCLMALAWLLGFVGLAQAIGDRLPFRERVHGRWMAFLVGALCVTFLGALPWVGWLVVLGASLTGMGAAVATRFGGT